MTKTNQLLLAPLFILFASIAHADQGSFTNSGGLLSAGTAILLDSTVPAPAGPLSIDCPITATYPGTYAITYDCAGGSLTFNSTDGNTALNASFISGVASYTCSGGGKGGNIKCGYAFSATFSGTLTLNGQTQAITGETSQSFVSTGGGSGATAYNSAYTPFYFSNGQQILRSDDLLGTNLLSFGSNGGGVGQFYDPAGIALDAAGRIYIADVYNARIVRMDDITGKNWTTYGSYGSGDGQFMNPMGVFLDSTGRIYVVDTSNFRIVRIDDMSGANWVSFGTGGSGVGQFGNITSIAVDPSGHIYIADPTNKRLVRMDDMTGTNWIALTQSPDINGYIYSFLSPSAVTLDPSGEIYVADSGNLIRIDDMAGTNWTTAYNIGSNLIQISSDASGTIFTGGYVVTLVDSMAGEIASSNTAFGNVISGIAPVHLASPRPPAVRFGPAALSFGKLNIGNTSAPQPVTVTNFGGSPLNFSAISVSSGFVDTNNCTPALIAGSTCTVSVSFAPTVTGPANGVLTLSDNSGNSGASQRVTLTATGTAPAASVFPAIVAFPAQALNTASATQSILLTNAGTGPLQVNAISVPAPFSQTNNCGASVGPGMGCTVAVSFTPTATGPSSATLSLSNTIGTQTVSLTGTGAAASPLVTVSPAGVLFPAQEVNTTSLGQVVTLTNGSAATISITGVKVAGDFAETTTCGTSLKAGRKCTVTVTFAPTMAAARQGSLSFGLSSGSLTTALDGIGVAGTQPSSLSFNPRTLDFTGYVVGDNPTKSVVVTNVNGVPAGIAGISFKGNSVFAETNRCPSILAPGGTCKIEITFKPRSASSFSGAVTVDESSGVVDTIPVTGSATTSGG